MVCREILAEGQLMATNSFVRLGDRWHMIGHHSGQRCRTQQTNSIHFARTKKQSRKLQIVVDG